MKVHGLPRVLGVLLVDNDLTVVATRGDHSPKLRVCPRNLPHGASVPAATRDCHRATAGDARHPELHVPGENCGLALLRGVDIVDCHGSIGRACGKALGVVVELGVMLAT